MMLNPATNRGWFAAALLAAAALAAPTAASAAEDDLVVSTDGTHYSSADVLPVFADDLRLVPGDRESASFWIRNDSAHTGRLRLDLVDPVSVDAVFATHVELAVAPDGTGATPITMSTALANGSCTVLSGDSLLAPGQAVQIRVTASLSSALTDEQGALADLRFEMRAVLADAAAVAVQPAGAACTAAPEEGGKTPQPSPTSSPSALAATGGAGALTAAAVGGAATVAGMIAFLWARRRRSEGDEADA
ncbi:hypothetical protein [Microbacterium sp.]|uniref:hypothetical protein n=1 Tax=Microbacterium sp. TaxID=51671 RepID=UPI0028A73082|nr:hypothetical protein [Microbacterium sp.]